MKNRKGNNWRQGRVVTRIPTLTDRAMKRPSLYDVGATVLRHHHADAVRMALCRSACLHRAPPLLQVLRALCVVSSEPDDPSEPLRLPGASDPPAPLSATLLQVSLKNKNGIPGKSRVKT